MKEQVLLDEKMQMLNAQSKALSEQFYALQKIKKIFDAEQEKGQQNPEVAEKLQIISQTFNNEKATRLYHNIMNKMDEVLFSVQELSYVKPDHNTISQQTSDDDAELLAKKRDSDESENLKLANPEVKSKPKRYKNYL